MDKRRPALVVSPDFRNAAASDVIVIPCSTQLGSAPTHVRLRQREGGVPRSCMLACEQITTVLKELIEPHALGDPVSRDRMAEVERAILIAVGMASWSLLP